MVLFPAFIGNIGWQELLVILVLVVILFGPKRLPEVAEAIGKSIRRFKSATREAQSDLKKEIESANDESPPK